MLPPSNAPSPCPQREAAAAAHISPPSPGNCPRAARREASAPHAFCRRRILGVAERISGYLPRTMRSLPHPIAMPLRAARLRRTTLAALHADSIQGVVDRILSAPRRRLPLTGFGQGPVRPHSTILEGDRVQLLQVVLDYVLHSQSLKVCLQLYCKRAARGLLIARLAICCKDTLRAVTLVCRNKIMYNIFWCSAYMQERRGKEDCIEKKERKKFDMLVTLSRMDISGSLTAAMHHDLVEKWGQPEEGCGIDKFYLAIRTIGFLSRYTIEDQGVYEFDSTILMVKKD